MSVKRQPNDHHHGTPAQLRALPTLRASARRCDGHGLPVRPALPIPAPLLSALESACSGRSAACYVVPGDMGGYWSARSFYGAFERHCKAAELPAGVTPHTLRHTLATHMSARGVPLRIIQQWLGHERIETTSVYLQVAPEFMTDALSRHVLNVTTASVTDL